MVTLEEAQEKIVQLQEQVANLTAERDTLTQARQTDANEIERLRQANQRYFERIQQHYAPPSQDPTPTEPTAPTCEDFARNLKI